MSARDVIVHALRVYYAGSREPNGVVDKLLADYDAERDSERPTSFSKPYPSWGEAAGAAMAHNARMAATRTEEKDTRGESPQQGESTHRHPRPCEFPTTLPCTCPRPSALPDASFVRARRRAGIAAFFHGARDGRAAVWVGAVR